MSWSQAVRTAASERRRALGLGELEEIPAPDIAARLAEQTGIGCYPVARGSALLAGARGLLDKDADAIYLDAELAAVESAITAAHEFGHYFLHAAYRCDGGTDEDGALYAASDIAAVDGYSPVQRRELEANIFAAEMVLPRPLAAHLFLDLGLSASEIADRLGLPRGFVVNQLAEAVLAPPTIPAPPTPETPQIPTLDESQQRAAEFVGRPLLLGAGPGTGKTRTLVGRCLYLTREWHVPPHRILALTFSRKAAQEMRERLTAAGVAAGDAGPWVGTFHGFGLEILRRFGQEIGLPDVPKLLTPLDSITLLENNLPALGLSTLHNLANPALYLPAIMRQISRAKDELCSPERYAELAAQMQDAANQALAALSSVRKPTKTATDVVERLFTDATKAAEVARCYAIYERLLADHGAIDYADLISKSVELLRTKPHVTAQLQAEYRHILADEYQDVNRATTRMLALLAGPEASGLWVVGDHRQSIYRFRGASPASMAQFLHDYPEGRRLDLEVNYRSVPEVVDLIGAASTHLQLDAVPDPARWIPERGPKPTPAVRVCAADGESAQAAGIVESIRGAITDGRAYGDMAILCRSHAQAEKLASALTAEAIPVLYVGDLLESPDVRDILCLMSAAIGDIAPAILRCGVMTRYGLSQEALLTLLSSQPNVDEAFSDALAAPPTSLADICSLLKEDLDSLAPLADSPKVMMEAILFEGPAMAREMTLGVDNPFLAMQKRLMIHQLLALADGFESRAIPRSGVYTSRVAEFLDNLQRMRAAGESPRGQTPDAALGIDAVRIMTVHGAKGLEFPLVFLPYLGDGQFPARGHGDLVPEPPGLSDAASDDGEEERCLFFVALSRARDELIISWPRRSAGGKEIKPSPLLEQIWPWMDAHAIAAEEWAEANADDLGLSNEDFPPDPPDPDALPVFSASALETYMRCPRRYHYEHRLGLQSGDDAAYPRFHACVRTMLAWLRERQGASQTVTEEELRAELHRVWCESGPCGDRHEAAYRESAETMLLRALERPLGLRLVPEGRYYTATLANCRVRMRPDAVMSSDETGATHLAKFVVGKRQDDEHREPRLAVLRQAARERPETTNIELHYLQTGDVEPVEHAPRYEPARLRKYEEAAAGIAADNFAPEPGQECRWCPFVMICPT